MFEYPLIGLASNRPIPDDALARCRTLVAAIAAAAPHATGFGRESDWLTPDGKLAYGGITQADLTHFDDAFVRSLRHHCYVFTGYHLRDLIDGTRTPSWTDQLERALPDKDLWQDWSIPVHLAQRTLVPESLLYDPPRLAGEVGFEVDGRLVNRDVAAYQERLNLLHEGGVLDRLRALPAPRLLEIGGGYGALAHALTRLLPQARYTIVDLPSSLMYSGCYLTVAQDSHAVALRDAPDAPAIRLLPNHAAETLRGETFDLAINTLSFAEMPAAVVARYGTLIAATLAPEGQLFEQNFERYGPDSHFCSPSQVLRPLFGQVRSVGTGWIWGAARLWSV